MVEHKSYIHKPYIHWYPFLRGFCYPCYVHQCFISFCWSFLVSHIVLVILIEELDVPECMRHSGNEDAVW